MRLIPTIQTARDGTPAQHIKQTLRQIVVFWSFFLGITPALIRWLEIVIGIPAFVFQHQVPLAVAGLSAASALGLWSAVTMAALGNGTPLPTQCARKLVIAGPYRYVRNPMAVAGLAQGAFVGIGIGSYLTLIYVATGLLLWNYVARPIEERDLQTRFGEDYTEYCATVLCWIPRIPAKQTNS